MKRIKLILYAILAGLFWDGLVILLHTFISLVIPSHPFINFIICILVLTAVADLFIYKVFIVKNKTAYALICIPSAYFGLFLFSGVLDMFYKGIFKYWLNAVLICYYSMFTSIFVCAVVMIVRKLNAKRKENGNVKMQ